MSSMKILTVIHFLFWAIQKVWNNKRTKMSTCKYICTEELYGNQKRKEKGSVRISKLIQSYKPSCSQTSTRKSTISWHLNPMSNEEWWTRFPNDKAETWAGRFLTYSKRDRSRKRPVTPKQTLIGGTPTAKHRVKEHELTKSKNECHNIIADNKVFLKHKKHYYCRDVW